ncbi:Multidrug resistance protein CDR1 [Fusarium oxysporum f. sp. albedinis]|nr:Multidrug resistance protein CDR1 [Fusarium oxysporum f. sp. albedinis]
MGTTDNTRKHHSFFLTPRASPSKQRKREVENTPVRRPSTPTPTARPKARPQSGSRSSNTTISIQPPAGVEDMHSSTRVGSVALLGNQEKVEYYRNDSLKYCRHEEEKKKKSPKGWREGALL